jgi:hypothetical protein
MDTSEGKQERKFKGTCNWCGYKSHMERECRQKAAGKPRRDAPSDAPQRDTAKCFRCGQVGHWIADCKARVVFAVEEENKDQQQYDRVVGKGKSSKGKLSKIVKSLPKLLNSHSEVCKSMISTASKPNASTFTPTTNSQEPQLATKTYKLESSDDEAPDLTDDDSDGDSLSNLSNWAEDEPKTADTKDENILAGCVFTMEDGSHMKLQDVLSTAGARAATVKGNFCGKPINILLDTDSDIVCVSSRIAPRSEWKKMHGLHVRGFNGGIVNCPTKADIAWTMGGIKSE